MTDRKLQTRLENREQRLLSITSYSGTAADLAARARDGSFCRQERKLSQCGACSSFAATLQLSLIEDAAVVNHAPAGCAGDFAMFNLYNRYGQTKRGRRLANAHLISTNLRESDVVFGASRALGEAVREAYRRFGARAVFVTASCVSGIIGEDLEGTIRELEKEIGIPVIPVWCEGVSSQVWATGWDAAFEAILQRIVKPPRERRPNLVNIVNFIGDDYFSDLLRPLGLEPNFVVPFTTIGQLERISEAGATVQMCPTLGTLLGAGLERMFGVREVKVPPPYGLAATDRWLRELGRMMGKEADAEILIAEQRAAIMPELESLRRTFQGARALVAAGPAHGHAFMCLLNDLGFRVVGGCGWHHDARLDHGDPRGDTLQSFVDQFGDVPYSVCHKQPYELVKFVQKLAPDVLVIRHPSLGIWGARLGIPTFFVDDEHLALGYGGLLRYGRKVSDWFRNPSLERNLAQHMRLPYSKQWISRSSDRGECSAS